MILTNNTTESLPRPIVAMVAAAVFLSSCQTSPQPKYSDYPGVNHRIKKHILKYNELSEQHKTKVRHGEIVEGMSKDAVFLAWGEADRVQQASSNGKKSEHWIYLASDPVSSGSVGYGGPVLGGPWGPGYHHGGPGWGVGSDIHAANYVERSVDFANHRVIGWKRSQ